MSKEMTKHEIEYRASSAIVIYEADEKPNMFLDFPAGRHYATIHRVVNDQLAEGRPISKRGLLKLCKLVIPSIAEEPFYIPEAVIAYMPSWSGEALLAWWVPASKRSLFFDASTGIRSGVGPVPPMFFVVSGASLHVWTLKENKRPGPETEIFHTPFYNVTNGAVCMGDVTLPGEVSPDETTRWEDLFFGSTFSGHGVPQLDRISVKDLWNGLIGKNKKTFPSQYLSPAGQVSAALRSCGRGGLL